MPSHEVTAWVARNGAYSRRHKDKMRQLNAVASACMSPSACSMSFSILPMKQHSCTACAVNSSICQLKVATPAAARWFQMRVLTFVIYSSLIECAHHDQCGVETKRAQCAAGSKIIEMRVITFITCPNLIRYVPSSTARRRKILQLPWPPRRPKSYPRHDHHWASESRRQMQHLLQCSRSDT